MLYFSVGRTFSIRLSNRLLEDCRTRRIENLNRVYVKSQTDKYVFRFETRAKRMYVDRGWPASGTPEKRLWRLSFSVSVEDYIESRRPSLPNCAQLCCSREVKKLSSSLFQTLSNNGVLMFTMSISSAQLCTVIGEWSRWRMWAGSCAKELSTPRWICKTKDRYTTFVSMTTDFIQTSSALCMMKSLSSTTNRLPER